VKSFDDEIILVHLSVQIPPEIKITVTKARESRRPEFFAACCGLKHLGYRGYEVVSNNFCDILLEIATLFFSAVDSRKDSVSGSHMILNLQFAEETGT
jgi:hypothetical protein